jgi:hypothetical protein
MESHNSEDVYEAPTLTELGTLAELTKGNSGTIAVDLNLAISINL